MLDIFFGIRPSPYEDLNGSYSAPKFRFVFLYLAISLPLSALVNGIFSSFSLPGVYVWGMIVGGALAFFSWVLVNVSAYLYWLRRERIKMIEDFTAPKTLPETLPEPVGENLQEQSEVFSSECIRRVWNGKIVDGPMHN